MALTFNSGWTLSTEQITSESIVFRNNGAEIAMDFESDENVYTVVLTQHKPNHYRGNYTRRSNGELYEGKAHVQLFENENGYLLFGHWNEEGDSYKWWIEVEHIDD